MLSLNWLKINKYYSTPEALYSSLFTAYTYNEYNTNVKIIVKLKAVKLLYKNSNSDKPVVIIAN